MTQAWTQAGSRVAITRCKVEDCVIVNQSLIEAINTDLAEAKPQKCLLLEVGYGKKKLKNMTKPLRSKIEKCGFALGVKYLRGIKVFVSDDDQLKEIKENFKVGKIINLTDVFEIGEVVKVQGKSKGRGFAGAMKRHGFHGGPRTHGQSDRERATGAIGAHTDPGRVWKGKKMPGHMGNETKTVLNLTVVHIDELNNELWISGPVPGHINSLVKVTKVGGKKKIELNKKASNINEEENKLSKEDKKEVIKKNNVDKKKVKSVISKDKKKSKKVKKKKVEK